MPTWSDVPAVRLGRLAGIPILLDVTALFAVFAILFAVVRQQFPSVWDYGVVFVLLVAGIFLSILVHEFGHALAARKFGLTAEEIRIGGFYGLAFLSGIARRRLDSILILLAGPFANALAFAVLWLLLGMPPLSGSFYFGKPLFETAIYEIPALRFSVQWLAYANFGMLVFNLLPAFPLDGGRVARLLLEPVLDYWRSVQVVAGLGILIGVWCCFGAVRFPVMLFVGPYLAIANYAILRGQIAAPAD